MANRSILEILAPAGGLESLTAAVRCGADAVYLGKAGLLNARRGAVGFDEAGLAEAVAYCHGRGVRVYLTLNTLVRETEKSALLRALEHACVCGVDAVLVQDLAVARIARSACPSLSLHASTQMSVTGREGALLLEEMGFSRVVLARELTLEEIADIRQGTSIELEVFVHGALCMSVSGQCYLSSVIGGRSGNRGLCAQPCRLPFACGPCEHALSLRDISVLDRLAELEEAGICSVKIEGRMKRPEYVAAAVTACVGAREGIPPDFDRLAAVFSRGGFTQNYLDGRRDASMYGIRRKEDVTATTAGLLKEYRNLCREEAPRVPVDFMLELREERPASLTVADRAGHRLTVTGEPPQPALTAPTSPERAAASLGKTGGTPFVAGEIQCELGPGLMVPASSLNSLRRRSLDGLLALREELKPKPFSRAEAETTWRVAERYTLPHSLTTRIRIGRTEQLGVAAQSDAELLILPEHLWQQADQGLLVENTHRLAVELPRCTFGEDDAILRRLDALRAQGVAHAVVGSLGALRQARTLDFILHGDAFLNVVNAPALEEYRLMGLADCTLSFELDLKSVGSLGGGLPRGCLAYGYLPLMALRNCPQRAHRGGCRSGGCGFPELTDRLGKRFFLDCDGRAATLYNCVPLWMADRTGDFSGLDFVTVYLTRETPEEAARVWKAFAAGSSPEGEYTRGLYYRAERIEKQAKR